MKEIINMLKSIGVRKITIKSMEEIKCPRCGKDIKVENVIDYNDYVIEEIKFKYGNRIYLLKIQEFNITITDKKITFNFSRNRDAVDLIKDFLSM